MPRMTPSDTCPWRASSRTDPCRPANRSTAAARSGVSFSGRDCAQPVFGDVGRGDQRRRHRQRHPQHRGGRCHVIGPGPLDQAAEGRADRRHGEARGDRAELGVGHLARRPALRLPDDAGDPAWPERDFDDVAGGEVHAVGNGIVERAEAVLQDEDADTGHPPEIGGRGPRR